MAIRAVATDIDATLTDDERVLSLAAAEALRIAEDNGVPIMLVSGNVLPICHSLNVYLGLSGPIVAENGGVVFWKNGPRLKLLKNRKEADRGYDYLSKRLPVKRILTDRWRETEVAIEEGDIDPRMVRQLLQEGGFDLYVNSTGFGLHIMEPGLSKLKGLELACSWLGIGLDEVLAMGDSEADMEFLEHCGFSGVPANAPPELKAKAGYAARVPFGEGVVDILTHYKVI